MRTGEERALTSDGAPSYSWALEPFFTQMKIWPEIQPGVKWPPFQAYWSPDGRYVIAPRVDERGVGLWPYVEWVPTDGSKRPIVHNVPLPLPGDRATVKLEYFLFDLNSGQRKAIQLPQGYPELSWPARWAPVLGWSRSHGQAFILARTVGWKSGAVFRVDLATAKVTKVIEESAATRVEFSTFWSPSNVRLIGDGAEIVWYSERSGWAHLYLYDAQSGRLKNAITGGDWAVQDLQAIDEKRREIYFTGAGREPGQDLYYRQLYRAPLDGGAEITRLSAADADHQFEVGSFLRPPLSGAASLSITPPQCGCVCRHLVNRRSTEGERVALNTRRPPHCGARASRCLAADRRGMGGAGARASQGG